MKTSRSSSLASPLPALPTVDLSVALMRCACGIDMHSHVVPENITAYLESKLGNKLPPLWPQMAEAPAVAGLCHRHVMIAGKNYRTVSEKCWSVPHRLADMPELGLALQVISPMPAN